MKCYKIFVLIFFVFEGVAALPSPPDGLLRANDFPSTTKANATANDSGTKQARRREVFDCKAPKCKTSLGPSLSEAPEQARNDDADSLKQRSVESRAFEDLRCRQERTGDSPLNIRDEDTDDNRWLKTAEQHSGGTPLVKRSRQSKLVKSGIAVTALASIGGLYALLKKLVFDKNKGKPDEGPYPQPGDPAPTPRSLDDKAQDISEQLAKRDRRTKLIKGAKIAGAAATVAGLYYILYRLMTGKSDGRQRLPPDSDTPGPAAAPAPRPRSLDSRDDQALRGEPNDDGATDAERRSDKRAITLQHLHKAAQGGALMISLGALYYLANQMLKDSKAEHKSQQGQQDVHDHAPGPVSAPAPRPRSLGEGEDLKTRAAETPRQERHFEIYERGMSRAQKGLLRIGGVTTAMMTMTSLTHVAQKQKQHKHKQENESAKATDKAQSSPQRQFPVLRPRSLYQGHPCLTNDLSHDGAQLEKRLKGNWGKTVGGGVVGMCGLGMESLYAANALKKKQERQQKAYKEAKKYGPALMIKRPAKERR